MALVRMAWYRMNKDGLSTAKYRLVSKQVLPVHAPAGGHRSQPQVALLQLAEARNQPMTARTTGSQILPLRYSLHWQTMCAFVTTEKPNDALLTRHSWQVLPPGL
ncbi:hypothetical protein MRX96_053114 [Rhipicephalus microplus]